MENNNIYKSQFHFSCSFEGAAVLLTKKKKKKTVTSGWQQVGQCYDSLVGSVVPRAHDILVAASSTHKSSRHIGGQQCSLNYAQKMLHHYHYHQYISMITINITMNIIITVIAAFINNIVIIIIISFLFYLLTWFIILYCKGLIIITFIFFIFW